MTIEIQRGRLYSEWDLRGTIADVKWANTARFKQINGTNKKCRPNMKRTIFWEEYAALAVFLGHKVKVI